MFVIYKNQEYFIWEIGRLTNNKETLTANFNTNFCISGLKIFWSVI